MKHSAPSFIVAAVAAALLGFGCPAAAIPITYQVSAVASGTLGGSAFANALVTLTLTSDTSDVAAMPSGGAVNLGKTTVNVPGIGMGTLTDTFAVFASTIPIDPGSPGFPVLPYVAISLLDNPPSTATNVDVGIVGSGSLLGYDLRTPIGPITGFGGFVPDANPIHTTVGNLVFTSTVLPTSQGTFVATTVPEPASLILMSAGLLAFATRLRPRLMTGRGQL